jgi:hypothetical protein
LPDSVIIDEIQRAPELFLPIKASVDRNRVPGRFFLTGSADVMLLPAVADSLAGRIEIHTLWPLSQGEIFGVRESFIDRVFTDKTIEVGKRVELPALIAAMNTGGYPDILRRDNADRRKHWFDSYVTTLIERDVRDLRNIEQLTAMPKLIDLLASRSGGLLSYADIARSAELKVTTVKAYMSLLNLLFLVIQVRPWFGNLGKRLVKSPKVYLNDTGLLCHLLGIDGDAMARDGVLLGLIFENFVAMELTKQISWSDKRPRLYHFRTENGEEVDFVLESRDGKLVGIECKLNPSAKTASSGLRILKELTGKRFTKGIVLHAGEHMFGVDKDILAVPVSALWENSNGPAPLLGG